ncbi:MAG TPA: hypothetical protein VL022_04705 [Moheibacter sp.]|nr:hypothetical protein [Moheibacter sp.]
MPFIWEENTKKVAVEVDELVPRFWSSKSILSQAISRNKENDYGIKALQNGGGRGRRLLVDFDSLPNEVKEKLDDPRRVEHVLLHWYKTDAMAVDFYTSFKRADGLYLRAEEQQRYITNASVMIALIQLKARHQQERLRVGMSLTGVYKFLTNESNSFNDYLAKKELPTHNLPAHPTRFKEAFKAFKNQLKYNDTDWPFDFLSIVKDVEGVRKKNALKVDEPVLAVLTGLFSTVKHKPNPTDIHRSYEAFLSGYAEVYNEDTGEIYDPKEFPKLSESTIRDWLSRWEIAAPTQHVRSGDRQQYMGKFSPYIQLAKPEYAGSLISIDDRQPPFEYANGKRVWFYVGIDLGSECITTFVHGKSKEGIITQFYRQMVRNYADWGYCLPDGLECESSLNSSFKNTFLQPGSMFNDVRIEANSARSKKIERYFGALRYGNEKQREGWIARPFAKMEANQKSNQKVPLIPYDRIINECIADIFDWNNSPHKEDPSMTRWEYFQAKQHPDLRPINWQSILPHLGYEQETSCNLGLVRLQGESRAIAENDTICTGDDLITKLKQIEGKNLTVRWMDDNTGNVLKALAFHEGRFVCELKAMPKPNRAKIERTDEDEAAFELQSRYKSTVDGFIKERKNELQNINILHKPKPIPANGFYIPGYDLNRFIPSDEPAEVFQQEDEQFDNFRIKQTDRHWSESI